MKFLFTLLFAASVQFIFAQNQAFNFDGTDDAAVSSPITSATSLNKFTIETWVKLTDDAADSSDALISLFFLGSSRPMLEIWHDRSGVKFGPNKLVLSYYWGSGNYEDIVLGYDFPPDEWKHIALVFNGTSSPKTLHFFVDGSLQATMNPTRTVSSNFLGSQICLGKMPASTPVSGHFLAGTLDDVRIWKINRTAAQIAASYNTELTGAEANLLSYYKLNGGSCGGYDCGMVGQNIFREGIGGTNNLPQFVVGQALTSDPACPPLLCPAPLNGTYTIGGTVPNYATIKAATDDLRNRGTLGNVNLQIRPGTYPEYLDITFIHRSNPNHKIIFQKDTSVGAGIVNVTGGMKVKNVDRLEFQSIKFSQSSQNIRVENCQHISFRQCEIYPVGASKSGLEVDGKCDSFLVDSCLFSGGSIGLRMTKVAYPEIPSIGTTIKNSLFAGNATALYLDRINTNLIVSDCKFQSQSSRSVFITDTYNALPIAFLRNRFMLTGSAMPFYVDYYSGTDSTRLLIANNYISSSGISFLFSNVNYINIFHNNIRSATTVLHSSTDYAANIRLKNNIITSTSNNAILSLSNSSVIAESDYNNFFLSSNQFVYTQTPPTSSNLSFWRLNTGNDMHSLTVNPFFPPTGSELTPNNPLLDSAGTIITGVPELMYDIDHTQHTNPPDIGAKSFTPTGSQMCGTFTIGGAAPDFINFTAAAAALAQNGVGCDVNFLVRAGIYNENPLFTQIPKVHENLNIIFQPDPANTDTIILKHSANPLRITGVGGIRFNNIGFLKTSASGSAIATVTLVMASSTRFDKCTFVQPITKICLQSEGRSDSIRITNCKFTQGEVGIRLFSAADNTQITDNSFTNHAVGIWVNGNFDNLIIEHNNLTSNVSQFNELFEGSTAILVEISGLARISNNIINKTHGTGISLLTTFSGIISNNYVSVGSGCHKGILAGSSTNFANIFVLHNTVILQENPDPNLTKNAFYTWGAGTQMRNNIFAYFGPSAAAHIEESDDDEYSNSDYNVFYSEGTYLITSETQGWPTLADWQAVSDRDFHSISVDPEMSAADPQLPTNSQLDGAGNFISDPTYGVLTDLAGTTRQNPPDIGAREMPDTYHNLGITALVSPTSTCNLTGSQIITIRVKNFGTTPETGFNLGYSVNGGPAVNQTFSNSIAPGDSALFAFATPFNFASTGTYVFKVFSLLPNDFNSANDTLTRTVNSFSLPSLLLASSTYSSCGGATGSLTFAATGGKTPYSFSIGGTGQASDFFGSLLPGNYTATVTDANTCSASLSATVVQLDIVPPAIIGCPANIVTQLSCGSSNMPIFWTAPTATDDCGLASFSASQMPGNIFTLGVVPITYSATDISGNTSVCQFTVTIHPAGTKCVWRGGTGSWHDPTKWLCGYVPAACDTAVISSGNVNVLATAPANVLMLNGGKILGSASLMVSNGLIWSSGTLDVSTTLAAGSANYFAGGSLKLTKNLISSGTVNFASGTLQIGGGVMFASSGTFRLTGPSVAFQKSGGTPTLPAEFANTGLLELTSPNTVLTTNFQFSGDGDYALSSGSELRINANFALSGNLHFGSNALVRVQKGTTTFAATASSSGTSAKFILEGSSIFETNGGLPAFADIELNNPAKWQLNYDFSSTGNLDIKGGTLEGSGSLTLENLNWSGGTLQLPITATANALVNAGFGTGTGTLAAPFVHEGVFNLNSGKLSMKPGGSLTNTGQFFLRSADAAILRSGSQTTQLFDNQGLFAKTITSGSLFSNIAAPFLNDSAGTVLGVGNLKFSALTNHGIFAPGTDTATALLRVQNNWTNGAELKIKIGLNDLGNPVHDKIEVTAKATLNDLLTVEQTADSIPDGSYEILSCGTPTGPTCRTGTFNTTTLPPGYTLQYTPKAVFLVKNTTFRPDRAGEKTTSASRVSCSPNPFRNETTVRISLPESSDVNVTVFNGLGEQIAVLQPKNWLSAGEHQWVWQPVGLPAGAYFVRVKIGHELQTLPVLLID